MNRAKVDDKAFGKELIALIPQLRAFGRSLSGVSDQGDDLAQATLAKAWASRASYEPGSNMKAWTFMILRNAFISDKRRSWRSCSLDQEVAEATLEAVCDPSSPLELDDLRRALQLLPLDQREAVILVGAAGFSYEETAAVVGAAVGTIKSRVSRARERLRAILCDGFIPADDVRPGAAMSSIFASVEGRLRQVA
jgi:RNA polymerase sigma-70 factor (ECF subfamily)